LEQQFAHGLRVQIAGNLLELEAVRSSKRQDDGVLGRRGLQLEVELAAEALPQAQAPGSVDAAAVGRVNDELRPAGLVEETLEHEIALRRQQAQRRLCRGEVVHDLSGSLLGCADLVYQVARGEVVRRQPCFDVLTQA
jgi:hypothetical protein